MARHLLTWIGVDDQTRVERASLDLGEISMRGIGGAVAGDFSSSWELDVGDGWITRSLRVTTRGIGWARSVELTRSDVGVWSTETRVRGDADLPAPGLADPNSVDGALDCDLGLCPVTNTMPIRRLGLLDHDVGETHLVMAWVEMPSLRVIRSDQVYASDASRDSSRVHYQSASRDFSAHLTVDPRGIVVDYPSLARRLDDRAHESSEQESNR